MVRAPAMTKKKFLSKMIYRINVTVKLLGIIGCKLKQFESNIHIVNVETLIRTLIEIAFL